MTMRLHMFYYWDDLVVNSFRYLKPIIVHCFSLELLRYAKICLWHRVQVQFSVFPDTNFSQVLYSSCGYFLDTWSTQIPATEASHRNTSKQKLLHFERQKRFFWATFVSCISISAIRCWSKNSLIFLKEPQLFFRQCDQMLE